MDERVWSRGRARAEGVSRRRLTGGAEFVRVVRGAYLDASWADDLHARCAAVLAALPHAHLSHWTALELHDLPVPGGLGTGIHVTVLTPRTVPRLSGVVGHESSTGPVYVRGGLRMTGPVRSWVDAAALTIPALSPGAGRTADIADLVAAGDALATRRATTCRDIGIVLSQRPRARGSRTARSALALLDGRAESPMESRLRVALVLAGIPPEAMQHEVRRRDGHFVARVDLAYPSRLLAVEYDGDHHRSPGQWRADLRRREQLERHGWAVVVVTAADLLGDPSAVVARVATRLAARAA